MSQLHSIIGDWTHTDLVYEFSKPYMVNISSLLKKERMKYRIRPKREDVFNAFKLTSLKDIRVVILGKEPVGGKYSNGLAYSCIDSLEPTPQVITNIFNEINTDIKFSLYHNPDLTRWAIQGVLLLNTSLTMRDGVLGSHKNLGWDSFIENTLRIVTAKKDPIVFILLGRYSMRFSKLLTAPHHVIYANSPYPESVNRGFYGSRCFSRANKFLEINYNEIIKW